MFVGHYGPGYAAFAQCAEAFAERFFSCQHFADPSARELGCAQAVLLVGALIFVVIVVAAMVVQPFIQVSTTSTHSPADNCSFAASRHTLNSIAFCDRMGPSSLEI